MKGLTRLLPQRSIISLGSSPISNGRCTGGRGKENEVKCTQVHVHVTKEQVRRDSLRTCNVKIATNVQKVMYLSGQRIAL